LQQVSKRLRLYPALSQQRNSQLCVHRIRRHHASDGIFD